MKPMAPNRFKSTEILSRLAVLAFPLLLLVFVMQAHGADRFVSLSGSNVPPYLSWADAATNIQYAVDAAQVGDTIWVTNGIYSSGGKALGGTLTNRVAITKAVTVRSVNGAEVTIIQGAYAPGGTNGPGAVRCAHVETGAALIGFTLERGATELGGSGGGVFCSSNDATLSDCIIQDNKARDNGGGVYSGRLIRCRILRNVVSSPTGRGGGAYGSIIENCVVMNNSAWQGGGLLLPNVASGRACINSYIARNIATGMGGGIYGGTIQSCTIVFNSAGTGGGGVAGATADSSIIYHNTAPIDPNAPGIVGQYSCSVPALRGSGNITADPQLFGMHIAFTSPCRGTASPLFVAGKDIDGDPWANPPSMGCDEPGPYSPSIHYVDAASENPLPPYDSWQTAARTIQEAIEQSVPGAQVFVTNGVYSTGGSAVHGDLINRVSLEWPVTVQSVNGPEVTIIQGAFSPGATNGPGAERCAYVSGGAVLKGFTLTGGATRTTGETNWLRSGGGVWCASPDAVVADCIISNNAADIAGGGAYGGYLTNCILVANVAPTGGGGISNRLDRCLVLRNKSLVPVGRKSSGGGTAYCSLSNCTVQGNSGDNGGGVVGGSLVNCLVISNTAGFGAGVYNAALTNCSLIGNAAGNAGGAGGGVLVNCRVLFNTAGDTGAGISGGQLFNCVLYGNRGSRGAGAWGGVLNNCTVTGNYASSSGGGVRDSTLTNCIVWQNYGANLYNSGTLKVSYSCTDPVFAGPGNFAADPLFLEDGWHIAANSPCRGAGFADSLLGSDIDGQAWANPPSVGCDEWGSDPVIIGGPKIVPSRSPGEAFLSVQVVGSGPFFSSWTKDQSPLYDNARYTHSGSSDVLISDFGPMDSGMYQAVVSNSFGVATSQVNRISIHCVGWQSTSPEAPFTNWSSAAHTIQEAIDAGSPGAVVLVRDGIYAQGGRAAAGDLTNRVFVDKELTVMSLNGPRATIIEGRHDPATTNGPAAERCAWVASRAVLSGFTLRNGATRSSGDVHTLRSGGGAWCDFPAAIIDNCVLSNNVASFRGGGAYYGLLRNCILQNNYAYWGAGVISASVQGSVIVGNSGPGADSSTLDNCTVTQNKARGVGWCVVRNSIVCFNELTNHHQSTLSYSCSTPLPPGPGNLDSDPQLVDQAHIALTSPCRSAGATLIPGGWDLDQEAWLSPPSIGCDEPYVTAAGPLTVLLIVPETPLVATQPISLSSHISGRASHLKWFFGDGVESENLSFLTTHTWAAPGQYTVTLTAYNADNPEGVSSSIEVQVLPLQIPLLGCSPESGGIVNLNFGTQLGVTYRLEYATNLAPDTVWHLLKSFQGSGTTAAAQDLTTHVSCSIQNWIFVCDQNWTDFSLKNLGV